MEKHNPIDYILDELKNKGKKVKLKFEGGIGKERIRIPHPRCAIFENRGSYLIPQWDRIAKEEGWNPNKIYFVGNDSILAEIVNSAKQKYKDLSVHQREEF